MDGMTINHIVSIDHGSYETRHVQAVFIISGGWCYGVTLIAFLRLL